jgi:hypothetical protein
VERRKRYSRKFQRMAVERMRTCVSVDELAKERGVTRQTRGVQPCSLLWTMGTVRTKSGLLPGYLGKGTQTPSPSPEPDPC